MPSALSRRLEARKNLIGAHLARPDLVLFEDGPPRIEVKGCVLREGKVVRPASTMVGAKPIPNRTVKMSSLSGLGDAIWTRGVVRETIKAGLTVYLDTPYEWCFWDFEGMPGFNLWRANAPPSAYGVRTATYLGRDMRDGMPVYGAMCERCKVPRGDFKMPIHQHWSNAADEFLAKIKPKKPVMIYRPLLKNHSRRSVTTRNPDHDAYSAIFQSIRDRFHVISVATVGNGEDLAHADQADTTLHRGELPIQAIAGLMSKAALVFAYPGMGLVLAAGIGAPVIGVIGGYEDAGAYSDTCIYGPSLLIDPIHPCRCYSDRHDCQKAIDVPVAIRRAQEFCDGLL